MDFKESCAQLKAEVSCEVRADSDSKIIQRCSTDIFCMLKPALRLP